MASGAAFLMATSAIGPGFLTQTAVFAERQRADFAFAILLSVLLAAVVQLNVWRVLGASGQRAPALASSLLPGLGHLLVAVVFLGGLVFNVGNVAGCGLGLAVFGVPERAGALLSALAVMALLGSARAGAAMDRLSRLLGAAMILLTLAVALASRPPLLQALRASVAPGTVAMLPVLTLLGGTVGGYIPFSGAHRLLEAGVQGRAAVPQLTRSALLGVGVTAAMRVLFFLAVLGVVSAGGVLDPANPPASAFRLGAGAWGERLFGLVLWSAAVTSVVGCTYTSLSFAEELWPALRRRRPAAVAGFVAVSLLLFAVSGRPVLLLIVAGALNGLVLPVTLAVTLLAARRRERLDGYRHPLWLAAAGWAALAAAGAAAAFSLGELGRL
ncbi:MAG TPA: NRAMP family divalent metal transporter, partial [Vicinamibacteria bacterium]|nr:NRAMP family divalent metal transporter [Vicinamibacteria bacterium]